MDLLPSPIAVAHQNHYYNHTQQSLSQSPPEPTIFCEVVFTDITSNSVNSTTTRQVRAKRKSTTTGVRNTAHKRGNIQQSTIPLTSAGSTPPVPATSLLQPVPGVGPQAVTNAAPRKLHPLIARVHGPISHHGSLLNDTSSPNNSTTLATDVWYFTRGLTSDEPPFTIPEKEKPLEIRPDPKVFEILSCIICLRDEGTIWKNTNGQSKTICKHMVKKHGKYWHDIVILKQLKGWQQLGAMPMGGLQHRKREPFSLGGFYDRLIWWVAVDDQSLGVVDCPEFCDLLLLISPHLQDADIPHRTKLLELIIQDFKGSIKQ
ncbi:hypothetical protein B0H34DRAFT_799411 [Crassisporium funariophilum]|nr:hypothetical protein B0H34DRAFT_799411 [Crassisporium funariophilum]